jgi:N-acetylmuramoyl-L-alanine amidase CwlA
MEYIKAHQNCYSATKRSYKSVKYIVIHNTGNKGDSARANGLYSSRGDRQAGAHYYIDQRGDIVKSVSLKHGSWSVGGNKWTDCAKTGGGKLYKKVTNANSVSIELCDIIDREPTPAMIKALVHTIMLIRQKCPNAQQIVRHFDVNGKHCPVRYMSEKEWHNFLKKIGEVGP